MLIEIIKILLGLSQKRIFFCLLEMNIHCTILSTFQYILNISPLEKYFGNEVEEREGGERRGTQRVVAMVFGGFTRSRMGCFYCFFVTINELLFNI